MDEIMRRLQGTSKETEFVGFGSLPVRMGLAECRSGSREDHCVRRANKKNPPESKRRRAGHFSPRLPFSLSNEH